MPLLQVSHLSKTFDGKLILNDISFGIDAGEIVCLLGPSGCGKTTLLRIITGLETADSGAITFDERDVQSIPVHERGFGLMFQDFALFPHKNVWDNVIFGLRMQILPDDQIQQLGHAALDMVGLHGFAQRNVHQLSGGERQRVALARSLAPKPRLLMLDEPLGALDRALREELMIEVRRILKDAQLTSIYVTHDQAEAFAIADRVAVMNAGHIEQIGAPGEVYAAPRTEFVARFLGLSNLIEGVVLSRAANVAVVRTPIGQLHLMTDRSLSVDQAVTLLIRPDGADLETNPFDADSDEWFAETPQANVLTGRVIEASFRGRYQRLVVRVNEVALVFEVETRSRLPGRDRPVKISVHDDALIAL